MECINVKKNRTICSCTYEPCERKGICCECIRYHRQNGELPACLFPSDIEKTFDRSIKRFVEAHK